MLMRLSRLLAAIGFCLLAMAPAKATEIIGNAPSWAAYAQAAAATGLTDAKGVPLTQGPLGGGSWFYNAVGDVLVPTGKTISCTGPGGATYECPEMQALAGKWVRVRFNGAAPNLPDLIKTWRGFGITIYEHLPLGPNGALCWSSDGVTCGPAYLDLIGVIA